MLLEYYLYNMDINSKLFFDYIKKENKDIKGDLISVGDDFKIFLNVLSYNTDYIGFYEENTKNAYFFFHVFEPTKFCSIIYNAWQLFHENDNINVKCYHYKFKVKNNRIKVYLRIFI